MPTRRSRLAARSANTRIRVSTAAAYVPRASGATASTTTIASGTMRRQRAGRFMIARRLQHPNRPRGRTTSTTASAPNSTNEARFDSKARPSESTSPITSAPTSAPRTEPRPPITTTTSARISTVPSSPGRAPYTGAPSTPAVAARTAPTANTTTFTLRSSTPTASTMWRSATVARTSAPSGVRSTTR